MDDANGSLKTSKPKAAINGAVKPALNGHAAGSRARRKPSSPGFVARTVNLFARLLTWYSIFTILFRCPASLDTCDESSPRICKPYFQLKQTVSPYLSPYYDSYAAPYVDLVKPYYDTVDQRVIAPGWGYAKKYGAPRVEQAQAFTRSQWEKKVQPQLSEYQGMIKSQYDRNLGPHINTIRTTMGPYYEIGRTNALQTYYGVLLPSYQYVSPYAYRVYLAASDFTTNTAIPSALWTWNKTCVFLDAKVWPHVKMLYVENVEPQLVKIGKRLGRYSSSKKTKSVPKPVTEMSASTTSTKTTSSFIKPTVSVTSSSVAASSLWSEVSSAENPSESSSSVADSATTHVLAAGGPSLVPIPPPEVDEKIEGEDPVRRATRETVAADLRDWQERYAKAAEEGAAEISNQVKEISKRMIRRNAKVQGKALLEDLQKSVVSELVGLRRDITKIVGSLKNADAASGGFTPEEAQEAVVNAVRKAGVSIKGKAQAVRAWREAFETEIQAAVTEAAQSHFVILENIRDLALQKIGMKWAWMDGVTYKDWAKYHQLKDKFEEWKGELQGLIVGHPSLEAAQLEAAAVEDEAMKLAGNAAKELARLKKVGGWKLIAADDTTEFDSELMQKAAEAAEAARNASPEAPQESATAETAGEPKVDAGDAAPEPVEGAGVVVEGTGDASSEALPVFEEEPAEIQGTTSPMDASDIAEEVSVPGTADLPVSNVNLETEEAASSSAESDATGSTVEGSHETEGSQTSSDTQASQSSASEVVEAADAVETDTAAHIKDEL
ncbi:hypothetical protein QBC47DRAFT_451940 [Echria macrotheca]|uniref:Transcription factor hoxa13 n=1 Tax=Echria macrotheca TaxID=438768 RepID=A0AAJ0BGL0_9PEZI|nr:hypothetical protein QBC47DRAFT_451940 [Echria macrotheca]